MRISLKMAVSLCLAAVFAFAASQCRAQESAKTPKAPKTAKPKAGKPAKGAKEKTMEQTQGPSPALMDPSLAKDKAPDLFKAQFTTTKGDFVVEVHRDWSPNGADRFYNMVKVGYYGNDVSFFRAIENFMVQFGITGDPKINAHWREATIMDDSGAGQSNQRGFLTFAKSGNPNSRSTQVFINFKDNSFLDSQGFTPFGKVVKGMEVVDSLYKGYADTPDQGRVQLEGTAYLKKELPNLDYIKSAKLVK